MTTKAVPSDTAGKLREVISRRASGAGGVCQQYPERPHSKGCRHFMWLTLFIYIQRHSRKRKITPRACGLSFIASSRISPSKPPTRTRRAKLLAEYLFPIFLSVPFSLDIVTDNAYKLPLSVTNCQTSDEKWRGGRVTELALLGFKIGSRDIYWGRGPSLSLIQHSN